MEPGADSRRLMGQGGGSRAR